MVVRRLENWPLLLSQFLRDRKDVPFEYGVNDCMLFCSDAIKAMTGDFDPGAPYRGTYSTEGEAAAIIEDHGGLQEFITELLAVEPSTAILTAGRGDAAMIETAQGLMAGIVDDSGHRIAVPISNELSVVRFPLRLATCIWRW